MTRRMTAVPLLKRRKWPRSSSDGSAAAPGATVVRLRAEKRAVGKRMLIALSSYIGTRAVGVHSNGYSPNCQERAVELRQMRMEMLFPDT